MYIAHIIQYYNFINVFLEKYWRLYLKPFNTITME